MSPLKPLSVPNDHLSMTKIEKVAKYYFWDQQKDCPKATTLWPRGCNVPVVAMQGQVPEPGQYRRCGMDHVLWAFWWAYARAAQQHDAAAAKGEGVEAAKERLKGFELLSKEVLYDFRSMHKESDILAFTFQCVEGVEEHRETAGFTGFKKVALVQWASKQVGSEKT